MSAAEDLSPIMSPEAASHIHGLAEGAPVMTLSEERFRSTFIQDGSRDMQDFVISALVPEPTAPFLEKAASEDFFTSDTPVSYVMCEQDIIFDDAALWQRFVNRLKNPTVHKIDSGHELMFTQPYACAKTLSEIAQL
jgi:hypothetical protein